MMIFEMSAHHFDILNCGSFTNKVTIRCIIGHFNRILISAILQRMKMFYESSGSDCRISDAENIAFERLSTLLGKYSKVSIY